MTKKERSNINYNLTPTEQLDILLEAQFGKDDDGPPVQRSQGGGINRTIATTNWSNMNFVQLIIAEFNVLLESKPAAKKYIDIFEYLIYSYEVLVQRLLKQEEIRDIFTSTDRDPSSAILKEAVLPKSLVAFMESLAPMMSPDGTKLVHAPYEYQQQNNGRHDDVDAGYVLTNGVFSVRAAQAINTLTTQPVANGTAATAVRCNIYELIRRVDSAAQLNFTAQQLNQWIGFDVFDRGYRKRPDHMNCFVVGQRMRQGSHFPSFIYIGSVFRQMYENPLFEDFNCDTWLGRKQRVTHIQTYDRASGAFRYSLIVRRSEVVVTPNIFTQATAQNISQMLQALGLPGYLRYRQVSVIDHYDKLIRLITSLRAKDFASLVMGVKEEVNLDF